jgi:hypothetical protein
MIYEILLNIAEHIYQIRRPIWILVLIDLFGLASKEIRTECSPRIIKFFHKPL